MWKSRRSRGKRRVDAPVPPPWARPLSPGPVRFHPGLRTAAELVAEDEERRRDPAAPHAA